MDGSIEHSDSDSGDSWTLLDPTPYYGNEAPEFAESHSNVERNIDKDEDTDGISVISESEPESPIEGESSKCPDEILAQYASIITSSVDKDHMLAETMDDEEFLVDNTNKHKTYVHRRNRRLSTVLNIIVLGSVITAAGVAIGHMWGAKNDCTINTTPTVNKILSNLYKLQEENSYLRSKIKELTLMHNVHVHHRKSDADSGSNKSSKCKKVFEDSLYNKNADKPIKCLDNEDASKIEIHLIDADHGKEFLSDIEKLKTTYEQNKSWLDHEVSKRLDHEEQALNTLKNDIKYRNRREAPKSKGEILETINEVLNADTLVSEIINIGNSNSNDFHERKISYSDSLKTDLNKIPKTHKPHLKTNAEIKKSTEKKNPRELDAMLTYSASEDEIRKDDRYIGHKHKQEKKKNDRQKLHKKQKRKNKYEQWEMKDYLKDYDEFSISSTQDKEYVMKNSDNNFLAKDFERENYIKQFLETDKNKKSNIGTRVESNNPDKESKGKYDEKNEKNKKDNQTWYDKRTLLRNEARKKLQHELFGETSLNNAGWYFRRMRRREQCRTKGDNSTFRKLSKRNMNFKMKH